MGRGAQFRDSVSSAEVGGRLGGAGFPPEFESIEARGVTGEEFGTRKRIPARAQRRIAAICPHAGCFVSFDQGSDEFKCPCHTSAFKSDGERVKPSVSPRDLDRLTAKVEDGSIMVAFANFIAGREEKTAKL